MMYQIFPRKCPKWGLNFLAPPQKEFFSLHRTKQIAYDSYLWERCGLSKERLHICNEGEMHVTSADSC